MIVNKTWAKMKDKKIRPFCTIDGCGKVSRSGSSPYCEMHYGRIRFKSPLGMANSETICRRCSIPLTGEQRFYCSELCACYFNRGIPLERTYKKPPAIARLPDTEREWRPVAGFSLYEISNDGLVRRAVANHSRPKGYIRKIKCTPDGYVTYNLYADDGETVTHHTAHRLVGAAFLPPPTDPEKTWVLHKNDVKTDNRFTNLKWGTPPENSEDAIKNGRIKLGKEHTSYTRRYARPRGTDHSSSKLSEDDVRDIISSSERNYIMAERYGVNAGLIYRIRKRQIWRHITDPENFKNEMKALIEAKNAECPI